MTFPSRLCPRDDAQRKTQTSGPTLPRRRSPEAYATASERPCGTPSPRTRWRSGSRPPWWPELPTWTVWHATTPRCSTPSSASLRTPQNVPSPKTILAVLLAAVRDEPAPTEVASNRCGLMIMRENGSAYGGQGRLLPRFNVGALTTPWSLCESLPWFMTWGALLSAYVAAASDCGPAWTSLGYLLQCGRVAF